MICPACLRPFLAGQERTAIMAGSRRLFDVHSGACAELSAKAQREVGMALFQKARKVLAQRAPLLSTVVENVAAIRRGES